MLIRDVTTERKGGMMAEPFHHLGNHHPRWADIRSVRRHVSDGPFSDSCAAPSFRAIRSPRRQLLAESAGL